MNSLHESDERQAIVHIVGMDIVDDRGRQKGSKFQERKFHGVYLVTKVLSPTSYRVKPVHRVEGGKLEMTAHATSLKRWKGDRDNKLQPTKRLRKGE
ncbi:hypothetical protein Pmar_PMAR008804 [Perkinsus marinus ATCC 50983]|uniref:Uncharacterized protein n=1 Tax=Perkinsus marinus (strain ATCC 50983 / TXsc) TaxID=423536 RepID=C5L123_PERM5|nr:hypothetical protein Pmar_PMAR008804 [Perkinsus marinus ATCC 50983]EER09665.1 hypothetical protein Pmar_PMAR008804 [Perkinsus marinus ATCC 50983]|eukprot:XP_002777870.1 hypothetical protein Pmar_PMAR008804 [Perkinsus marinus ATCC 50983]